jgi:parvulin-like peptidyl-prolyl isomerase
MLAFYRDHSAEYEREATAKWEHIEARFEKYRDKPAAYEAIAKQGTRIFSGASFAEVAKSFSDDATASEGGLHDWTTQGSLVSDTLDDAIFTLPVGRLSKILEDDKGFHIVRVVERKDAGRQPFLEAQAGIKKKISEERRQLKTKAYLEDLRKATPVWTVFDDLPSSG